MFNNLLITIPQSKTKPTLMLLRLTLTSLESLFFNFSRVSSTSVGLGGSLGIIFKASALAAAVNNNEKTRFDQFSKNIAYTKSRCKYTEVKKNKTNF